MVLPIHILQVLFGRYGPAVFCIGLELVSQLSLCANHSSCAGIYHSNVLFLIVAAHNLLCLKLGKEIGVSIGNP
jgi:hypothetical protein